MKKIILGFIKKNLWRTEYRSIAEGTIKRLFSPVSHLQMMQSNHNNGKFYYFIKQLLIKSIDE